MCRAGYFFGSRSPRWKPFSPSAYHARVGYRDDHEAAIARIDALEAEVESLRRENEELKRPNAELAALARPSIVTWALRAVATLGIIAGGGAAAVGVVAAFKSCASPGGAFRGPAVSGGLAATGPALGGEWTLEATNCASGAHMQFYGVDIYDKIDNVKVLRLVEDPVQGKVIKMNIPGTDRARFIAPSECKQWDWAIVPQGTTYNDIQLLDGHVALDCTFPEGGTFKGRIDFAGCR
jgi:hypothetical protein